MYHMYNLTEITGRKSKDNLTRTQATVELRAATWKALIISASVSFVLSSILSAFIGLYAIVLFLALVAFGQLIQLRRAKDGLQQDLFHTALDKRRSTNGQFFMCGVPIEPNMMTVGVIRKSTVPNPEFVSTDDEDPDPWSAPEGTTS